MKSFEERYVMKDDLIEKRLQDEFGVILMCI